MTDQEIFDAAAVQRTRIDDALRALESGRVQLRALQESCQHRQRVSRIHANTQYEHTCLACGKALPNPSTWLGRPLTALSKEELFAIIEYCRGQLPDRGDGSDPDHLEHQSKL